MSAAAVPCTTHAGPAGGGHARPLRRYDHDTSEPPSRRAGPLPPWRGLRPASSPHAAGGGPLRAGHPAPPPQVLARPLLQRPRGLCPLGPSSASPDTPRAVSVPPSGGPPAPRRRSCAVPRAVQPERGGRWFGYHGLGAAGAPGGPWGGGGARSAPSSMRSHLLHGPSVVAPRTHQAPCWARPHPWRSPLRGEPHPAGRRAPGLGGLWPPGLPGRRLRGRVVRRPGPGSAKRTGTTPPWSRRFSRPLLPGARRTASERIATAGRWQWPAVTPRPSRVWAKSHGGNTHASAGHSRGVGSWPWHARCG